MKYLKFSVLLFLLLPYSIFAQDVSLGINAGLTNPTGALSNSFKAGYNVGAEAVFSIIAGNNIYIDLSYSSLAPKDVINSSNYNSSELSAGYRRDLFKLGAPNGSNKIFLDVGAGLYIRNDYYSISGGTYILNGSGANVGINGGLGASIGLGPTTNLLARVKYHNIFSKIETTSYISIDAGINFSLY